MKRIVSQRLLSQIQLQMKSSVSKKYIKNEEEDMRSLYIVNFTIYVFTDCKNFGHLNIQLTNIAETITRPAHINQFEINKSSLQQAKALGYTYDRISHFFQKHMKNPPISESLDKLLRQVLNNDSSCRIYLQETKEKNFYIFQVSKKFQMPENVKHLLGQKLPENFNIQNEDEIQENNLSIIPKNKVENYQVLPYEHNELSKKLFQQQIPILSQKAIDLGQIQQQMHRNVDLFRNKGVLHCKNLKIQLKAFTKLRDYQIQALRAVVHIPLRKQKKSKIVAKSGYIVLPCGAGKTLLGISICCKLKKETLIVCSSDSGVDQWKKQIQKWTQGFNKQQIITLTAKNIDQYRFSVSQKKSHIYITTYSNLKSKFEPRTQNHEEGRKEVKVEHEWLKNMPWGLVVFDQAQWLPAPGNSQIVKSLLAHVKIGLTATPLRQDEEIKSLIYMIGPQLYVGSWRKFVQMGFLANPKCIEIRTKLPKVLQRQYDMKTNDNERVGFYQCNPNKIKTLMYLLHHHEKLNDQIIVFCDRISIIEFLAQKLKIPLLSGKTSIEDRNFVFDMFREGVYKTVLLSRIGDEAIDLPNANVAIEINIHKGSRRQMLQRLGRIMRPKEASSSESYNAIFYTIVTDKTVEMRHFSKRRECLVNLGFQYDLRFCEYDQKNILDILRDDRELNQEVDQKYGQIIDDELKFYQTVRTKLLQEDE